MGEEWILQRWNNSKRCWVNVFNEPTTLKNCKYMLDRLTSGDWNIIGVDSKLIGMKPVVYAFRHVTTDNLLPEEIA